MSTALSDALLSVSGARAEHRSERLPPRPERPDSDFKKRWISDRSTEPTAADGTDPSPMSAPSKTVEFREDLFGVQLWCTGTVRSVAHELGFFEADLVDDKGQRSSATIELDDVDPAERDFVVEGNRFTYVIFHEQRRTGLVNSDEIIMEPLLTWTAQDVARHRDQPREDLSFLDDDSATAR